MDKYEYKHLIEQIQGLIEKHEYTEAVAIADRIDWRRVRSVMTLGTISDLYKINCRYEDARDIMLLAYDRKPENRQICYSLCELYIKTGEMVEAVEFYKEFVQLAPKDPGRYVLQYKLYEANEVSLEERIDVLEELKKHEYQEKWMYELAYLYHRMGLATKCMEVCDELILWFGTGKYVTKAMELKMLHGTLTPDQQKRYENRFEQEEEQEVQSQPEEAPAQTPEVQPEETEEGAQELGETRVFDVGEVRRQMREQEAQEDEMDIQVKTVDVGEYNTMNLQAEIAAGLREVLESGDEEETQEAPTGMVDPVTRAIMAPMMEDSSTLDMPGAEEIAAGEEAGAQEMVEGSEVFFGETGEIYQDEFGYFEQPVPEQTEAFVQETSEAAEPETQQPAMQEDSIANQVMEQMRRESMSALEQEAMTAQPPEPMAQVLTQESDGQIKLVVPESKNLEKQITGQLSIEDIRAEWERMKKESQEKQEEEVRQQMLRQTGRMFTEFEEAMRDNILRQMENSGAEGALMQTGTEVAQPQPEPQENEEDNGWGMEERMTDEEDMYRAGVTVASEGESDAEIAYEAIQEEDGGAVATGGTIQQISEEADGLWEEVGEAPDNFEDDIPEDETAAGLAQEEVSAQTAEPMAQEAQPAEEEPVEQEAQPAEEEPQAQETQPAEEEPVEQEVQPAEEEPQEQVAQPIEEAPETESAQPAREEAQAQAEQPTQEELHREAPKVRAMTREEKELYSQYVQGRAAREQLVKAIDNISMAAYTGNVIVTGEAGMNTMGLAKNIIREVRMGDSNFAGKVAKLSGKALNNRDVAETIDSLKNGAMIIERACEMNGETIDKLYRSLQHENFGMIIVLLDTKKNINQLLSDYEQLKGMFTARVDMQPLSDEALVAFAQQYAREQEFSIDDLGMLALHTKIDEMQTIDHAVTLRDVKEIMDDAMDSASRKTFGHFLDILFGRRYDDEDMIIISEKDFV